MKEEYKLFKTFYRGSKRHDIYVSNLGNVKENDVIRKNPKRVGGLRVYVVVAKLFLPNPYNRNEVDHIDCNRNNNRVDNLRWVTHKENMNNTLTKQNMSEAAKQRWEDGVYDNMVENMKGHIPWNKGLPKEQQPKFGKKVSDETRQKMSNNRKGKGLGKWSEERKQELSNKLKGREFSEEHKKNLSNALKGKKLKPLSEEHKRKIAEATKLRWQKYRENKKNKL